jgi:hypothetical protein
LAENFLQFKGLQAEGSNPVGALSAAGHYCHELAESLKKAIGQEPGRALNPPIGRFLKGQ